jgi:hypothetical protein
VQLDERYAKASQKCSSLSTLLPMVVCVSEAEEVFKIMCSKSSHVLKLLETGEEMETSAAICVCNAAKDDSSSTFKAHMLEASS